MLPPWDWCNRLHLGTIRRCHSGIPGRDLVPRCLGVAINPELVDRDPQDTPVQV